MIGDILFAIWFLLPAAIANATPILAALVPLLKNWDAPVDGGKKFRGKELFGSHKTWRGFATGMAISTLVLFLQQVAYWEFAAIRSLTEPVNYTLLPTVLMGPLFGFGALGGDALKSFFKRQNNIPAGKHWIPFDQLDYIIGAIIVSLFFIVLPLHIYVWMLVVWFAAHLVASYIGWRLHLKDAPI